MALINPEIVEMQGSKISNEGCLVYQEYKRM